MEIGRTSVRRILAYMEARTVDLGGIARVLLVPLIGHTTGHCGVAIQRESGWLLHVGDSHYRRVEITSPENPVAAMAKNCAADNNVRTESLEELRRLSQRTDVTFFCAHDYGEYASKENPLNVDLPRA